MRFKEVPRLQLGGIHRGRSQATDLSIARTHAIECIPKLVSGAGEAAPLQNRFTPEHVSRVSRPYPSIKPLIGANRRWFLGDSESMTARGPD